MDPRLHVQSNIFNEADLIDFNDAYDFFESSAYASDDWQYEILKDWLAIDAQTGQFTHSICGLSVPRQNGKSRMLELRIIFGLVFLNERIIFSAHEVRTAREIFERLCLFFDDDTYPDIKESVKSIRKANGQEEIRLKTGARVQFMARTKSSGRGLSGDIMIFDEAQQLKSQAMAAMRPIVSTSKKPQSIYVGTPPTDDLDGETFISIRNQAIESEKTSTTLSWIEFAAVTGDDLDDPRVWEKTNPAFASGRILESTIADDRVQMSEEQFKRERLGMWETRGGASIVDMKHWQTLADPHSGIDGNIVLSIDISPQRDTGTISAAGFRSDGLLHVETLRNQKDISWIVPSMIQLRNIKTIKAVIIDGASPAATLIDDLKRSRFNVIIAGARDVAIASALFVDAVNESQLRHVDQPLLNTALAGARKRKLMDAFAFARSVSTTDITPVVSCSLALLGVNKKLKKRDVEGDQTYKPRPRGVVFRR